MGYKANKTRVFADSGVVQDRFKKAINHPFEKTAIGLLDYRLVPGTKAWNEYLVEGVQGEDIPHLAAFAEVYASYFDKPNIEELSLFDGNAPNWVFNPDMMVAKWRYLPPPIPTAEGEKEAWEQRLKAFGLKHKVSIGRPCVAHLDMEYLNAALHGLDTQSNTLIHVADNDAPIKDDMFWTWELKSVAYRVGVCALAGVDLQRVVFGNEKKAQDVTGAGLKAMTKLGYGLVNMAHLCYQEFVINEEIPPFV